MTARYLGVWGLAVALAGGVGCKRNQEQAEEAAGEVAEETRQAAGEVAEESQQAAQKAEQAATRVTEESAEALEQARSASEKATEQLDEAAHAQTKVAKSESELARARAEAERERAEARAAEDEARARAEQAFQRLTAQTEAERARQQATQQVEAEQTPPATTEQATKPPVRIVEEEETPEPVREGQATPPIVGRAPPQQSLEGTIVSLGDDRVLVRAPGQPSVEVILEPATEVNVDGQPATQQELLAGSSVRITYRMVGGERVADSIEQERAAPATTPPQEPTPPAPGTEGPLPGGEMEPRPIPPGPTRM